VSLATRAAFGEKVAELGDEIKDLVVLDADLAKSTQSKHFAKKFPERFFEMGIQEANMVGTAAGLAIGGKIPFLCSFACFVTNQNQRRLFKHKYKNCWHSLWNRYW
jgi:transketolase